MVDIFRAIGILLIGLWLLISAYKSPLKHDVTLTNYTNVTIGVLGVLIGISLLIEAIKIAFR